jgi:hypothetical protein
MAKLDDNEGLAAFQAVSYQRSAFSQRVFWLTADRCTEAVHGEHD